MIYTQRNQYQVVLEADPRLQSDPGYLDRIFVGGSGGTQVPLLSVVRVTRGIGPLAVRHQGQFPAATISYNIAPGTSEGDALAQLQQAVTDLHMPPTVRTAPAGATQLLAASVASLPLLILAAFLAIYIILGVLYESLTQPITIISTLFPAGLGALLALLITGTDLSVVAIIAILLLMGIVKKNAIMLIDTAFRLT